jgi:hypothetical protein
VLDEDQQERLAALRAALAQGDVIEVHAFATLGAPEATTIESTHAAEEYAEFRVTSVERRLPSGLWAIVTQTCDIARDLEFEPFLHLAPITESTVTIWKDCQYGRSSVRRYAYPRIFDQIEYPVLDIRIIQTIEKPALLADGVDPQHLRFEPHERFRLAAWLARRFARHAFPDQLEEHVLQELRSSARKRIGKDSEAGALLACREAVLVSYTEQGTVEVLFLLSQQKLAATPRLGSKAAERSARVQAGIDQIMQPVARHAADAGGTFTITWRSALPHNVPYADVLYRFHPVDLE